MDTAADIASGSRHGERLVADDPMIPEVAREDAQSVSALFGLGPVRVEDAQAVGFAVAGSGAQQHAVGSDAEVTIADATNDRRIEAWPVGLFEDEVIVAERVVLGEAHRRGR